MSDDTTIAELKRIKRVADQSCSAHARLGDRYLRQALTLDLIILSASAWILSLSFVDPAIAPHLTPFNIAPNIWTGCMGVATFIATLVQLKLDLKGRADGHRRACDAQAEVKKAASEAADHAGGRDRLAEVQAKLALASGVGVPIPENEFLRQKRIHLRKVALSQHLDDHPFASLVLLRIKWWWRDNVWKGSPAATETEQAP